MTASTRGRRPDRFLTGCAVWRGPADAWEITASSSGPEPGEVVVRAGTTSLERDLDGLHLSVERAQQRLIDLASARRVAASAVAIDGSLRAQVEAGLERRAPTDATAQNAR